MIDFAAKRGCPVCIRGWKMIAVAGTVAVVVALLMLRWHAGGHPYDGAVIAPVPVAPKGGDADAQHNPHLESRPPQ